MRRLFMRRSIFLFFSCLVFAVSAVKSQNKTVITGKVYDAQTRQPMPFVNLQLRNTTVGTTTDIDGNYKLETETRSDSLQVSYIGYNTISKAIKNHQAQKMDFYSFPMVFLQKVFEAHRFQNSREPPDHA